VEAAIIEVSSRKSQIQPSPHDLDQFRRKIEIGPSQTCEDRVKIEQTVPMRLSQNTQRPGHEQMTALGFCPPGPVVDQQAFRTERQR